MSSGVEIKNEFLKVAGKEYDIRGICGQISINESLSRHTTWKIGGPAKIYYRPGSIKDLQKFIKTFAQEIKIVWLGLGSNVLIRDGGIDGIVINPLGCMNNIELLTMPQESGNQLEEREQLVSVEAGATCSKFSRTMAEHGLYGSEFLSGIPGTIGGAIAMNAGAFGGECWEYIEAVESIDSHGVIRRREKQEYDIAYRSVKLKEFDNLPQRNLLEWFTKGYFRYSKDDSKVKESKQKIRQLLEKRNLSQPIKFANAGSVFKNPPGDYAARLIEACGLKGMTMGKACVSEKHANFIINQGGATAGDIENLLLYVQDKVIERFGIKLLPEVRILGERV